MLKWPTQREKCGRSLSESAQRKSERSWTNLTVQNNGNGDMKKITLNKWSGIQMAGPKLWKWTALVTPDRPISYKWPSTSTYDRRVQLKRPSTFVHDRPRWLKTVQCCETIHFKDHPHLGPSNFIRLDRALNPWLEVDCQDVWKRTVFTSRLNRFSAKIVVFILHC